MNFKKLPIDSWVFLQHLREAHLIAERKRALVLLAARSVLLGFHEGIGASREEAVHGLHARGTGAQGAQR